MASVNELFFIKRGCHHGVVVNMLDCDIVVNKFQLQSTFFVSLGIGMNSLIPPSYVVNSTTTVLLQALALDNP